MPTNEEIAQEIVGIWLARWTTARGYEGDGEFTHHAPAKLEELIKYALDKKDAKKPE